MPISQHSTPAPPDSGHLIAQARDGFAELDQIFTILTSLIDQRSVGYQLARDGRRLAERHHRAMQALPLGERRIRPRSVRVIRVSVVGMADLHNCPTSPKLTANDFNDIADIGLDRIAQLGSVFRAMIGIAEPESHLHHLAKIGAYLSEEWHFALDMSRYEKVQRLGVKPSANRITDRR